jgi:hypothetical protein
MANLEIPNINNGNQKPAAKLDDLSLEQLTQIQKSQKEFVGIIDEENKQLVDLTSNLKEKLNKLKESK